MAPSSRLLTRKAAGEDRMLVGWLRFKQYTPRRRKKVFMACFAARQADGPDFKFDDDNASASQGGVGGVLLFIAVSPCYCVEKGSECQQKRMWTKREKDRRYIGAV
jgi:hypothetical protein